MVDFDLILETIVTIVLTLYYLIEGFVKAILPMKYMPKKDLSQDTVLITGAGMFTGAYAALASPT